MANVYKNIQAVITSSASDDDMYTSPDATTSIVKTIKLYNIHSSNLVVDVKVYNWIKFADTTDMYITSEVAEIDLSSISKESINLFERYRSFYLDFFDQYRSNFVQSKFIANTERLGSEVNIVSETIKNKNNLNKLVNNSS